MESRAGEVLNVGITSIFTKNEDFARVAVRKVAEYQDGLKIDQEKQPEWPALNMDDSLNPDGMHTRSLTEVGMKNCAISS